MKLLLTSDGLTNDALRQEFLQLLGKDPAETDILVIPTAPAIFDDDKRQLIDGLYELAHMFPWRRFRLCDVAGFSPEEVMARVQAADVIYAAGGSERYLTSMLRAAGFGDAIKKIISEKLWVGVSAGSMIMCKTIPLDVIRAVYDEPCPEQYARAVFFELFDFSIIPHYGSVEFRGTSEEAITSIASRLDGVVYALSDGTALKIIDGLVEVVGDGTWKKF